jgi:nicotinamidase-related amidase
MKRKKTGAGNDKNSSWQKAVEGLRGVRKPPIPKKPALLVIDMQRYFIDDEAPAYIQFSENMLPCIQALIDAFEEARAPIFATKYVSSKKEDPVVKWWGTRLEPTSKWAELDPRMKLPKNAVVLEKHLYGTFSSTDLDKRLKKSSIDSVVICGVLTDICCETTAREAFQLGYDVYFLADCTATIDRNLHLGALAALAHGFAYILSGSQMLELMEARNG